MNKILYTLLVLLFSFGQAYSQEDASSMADLLKQIQQGQSRDSVEAQDREKRFQVARNEQQRLLNNSRAERKREEDRSQKLEDTFATNQQKIVDAREALDKRLGALKELFGVLQTVSGDAQTRFNGSLTNIQYPNREAFLVELGSKMASASSLASIQDIEGLWYELQREITEQGKIVKYKTEYATAEGERSTSDVVRVGVFNLVFEDGYLQYDSSTGNVTELQRQPDQSQYTNSAEDIMDQNNGYVGFGLDVTRGGILALLVESPTIMERINQGGIVGYCIIALGIVGLFIAIWRWLALSKDSKNVTAQLSRQTASKDNPLGRVLSAYDETKGADTETVELKLSEAALKEIKGLEVPLRFEEERYVGSSIQFRIPSITATEAELFIKKNKELGVELKWFGNDDPSGFTSNHKSWKYVGRQQLHNSDEILSSLFDLRLPLTFSIVAMLEP